MQYSHGICAATASAVSSLYFPGSAVAGFRCNAFISCQAPGNARSGTSLNMPGTNPIVFWMSARAMSASDVARAAPGAAAAARAREKTNSGALRAIVVMDLLQLWVICAFANCYAPTPRRLRRDPTDHERNYVASAFTAATA